MRRCMLIGKEVPEFAAPLQAPQKRKSITEKLILRIQSPPYWHMKQMVLTQSAVALAAKLTKMHTAQETSMNLTKKCQGHLMKKQAFVMVAMQTWNQTLGLVCTVNINSRARKWDHSPLQDNLLPAGGRIRVAETVQRGMDAFPSLTNSITWRGSRQPMAVTWTVSAAVSTVVKVSTPWTHW